MSTFVGNHDIPRPIHFAEDSPLWGNEWDSGKGQGLEQPARPARGHVGLRAPRQRLTMLFTIKGIPLVYYGDEVGLPGAGDPDNRRMMQWAGYSAGQSLVKDHLTKLAKIRADHVALRRGTKSTLSATNDTLAYAMTSGGDKVYVAINRSDGAQMVGGLPGGMLKDLLTGNSVNGGNVSVPARKSMILVVP
jgi:glycosidase